MEGYPDPVTSRGIIPNSFAHLFECINNAMANPQEGQVEKYLVRASYLEIYNDDVRDLLNRSAVLALRESPEVGVYVQDLKSVVVKNHNELDQVMQKGKANRTVGETEMNATSSRSHAIFTVIVECEVVHTGPGSDGKPHYRSGKLNLVDLAGSERQNKTKATGQRAKEGIDINKSLTCLGNVIKALASGAVHIPYRDCALTRLLQNSLGGNAKTVMIANCGPADMNIVETLSTLRYANRAKNIKNKPTINEDPKDTMLREYQEEIKKLREQLEANGRGISGSGGEDRASSESRMKQVVETIREVKVEVPVYINKGYSAEQVAEITSKAQRDRESLIKQAQADISELVKQSQSAAQKEVEMRDKLESEQAEKKRMIKVQRALQEKLKRALREKQIQEAELARRLAEKEEANLQMEEHYSSLQEEVEVKTAKLRKLWSRYNSVLSESKAMESEFENERTDFLSTIRDLTRSLALQQAVVRSFVPEERVKEVTECGEWGGDDGVTWIVKNANLTGNQLMSASKLLGASRPISSETLRRPEAGYARE
eukprot:gene34624-42711_t